MKMKILSRFTLSFCLAFTVLNFNDVQAQSTNTTIQQQKITKADLVQLIENNKRYISQGKVADYIPELGKADPNAIAIAVVQPNGELISAGSVKQKFTIQSISKIIALMLAVQENGEKAVFEKVGYYGTNQPFNHFANLDQNGKAFNPMMNAGAITVTAMISGEKEKPYLKILEMVRFITKNPSITINEAVYLSEKETGHRNRGMFHILKNSGLVNGTEDQLDNYFRQCSIEIDVEDLAKIGYFFAHRGVRFDGDKTYQNRDLAQLIQSQMLIAGMYDFSGEYARTIGLPSKSGVGGGITVSVPQQMGIGVYSPALDSHGNSIAGYHLLLDLVKKYPLSIF